MIRRRKKEEEEAEGMKKTKIKTKKDILNSRYNVRRREGEHLVLVEKVGDCFIERHDTHSNRRNQFRRPNFGCIQRIKIKLLTIISTLGG